MPEFKHHFRAGKMNKDLDERLVPNGEYRDAQNIEISTSEGSDVGSVQNVRGNTKISGKTYNDNTQSITANWGSKFGLTNPVCIGHVLNNETDKIYWFISADEADCIAEYDDAKGIISPVLVDANNILNFTSDQYITGINVLDGMLFWTDNNSEPKKIDIEVFKSGCNGDFTTHTKFTGEVILSTQLSAASAFTEEHITVAKQAPITAPTIAMSASKRGGNGTGTSPVLVTNSSASLFADIDGNGKTSGTSVALTFSPQSVFQTGDILVLTATYEELDSAIDYEIKVRVTSVSNSGGSANCKIQSIPVEVAYIALPWEALLEEEGVLFEKKMVRFGYRWKYTSGEYSVFSPFSELAFLPTTFEYLSSDGHNVGMINTLRDLTITIPSSGPVDVEEVDILYKESNNNNVYVVDTLKRDSYNTFDLSYKLESELIGKVVESNQMLRPWDNVPRKAKAQEITANRLIYANYQQQYDIPKYNLPDITLSVDTADITTVKEPELSIKSLRTYQAGIVYLDKYNRQTPVFTSQSASRQVPKAFAEKVSTLKVQASNTPPSWATHFKYYIKETSNEYYNLSMDRYYLAEDGNVWLSFPSSERNKIAEDSYIILKKQHDSDEFVGTKARYKVLDIQNEAPDFIKLTKKAIGKVDGETAAANLPQIGATTFRFRGPDPLDNPSFAKAFTSDGLVQISVSGQKTDRYNIVSGGYTGQEDTNNGSKHVYEVSIDEPLKEGETMLANLSLASSNGSSGTSLSIILFEEKFERKPEFYGRFFAKINRDSEFDTNIIETYPDVQAEFGISNSRQIFDNAPNTGPGDGTQAASWYDTRSKHNKVQSANNGHPVLGSRFMTVLWAGAPKDKDRSFDKSNTINSWLKALSTAGTLFRMKGSSSNNTSEVYKVIGCTVTYKYRRTGRKRLQSSKRRHYRIEFEHHLNKTPYEDTFTFSSDKIDEIQIVEKVISSDNEVLTSDNPAIWETEPKEAIDLDFYYETGDTLPIAQHGTEHALVFKNCYSYGNGVESDRLRDDFNAIKIDKGVKVSTVLAEQYKEEQRKNGLIYSGIFNSTSGINRLNQFIQGESITKDLNPHYGGIQKLHARNTDLIVLCEDKVLKVLANKDALYEAGGNQQLTATNRVLGQSVPFIGNYGISKNPESFASYAFRCYFTDKNRGAVLRLSRDGLTAISENGMRDYFKDNLPTSNLLLGSYDGSKGLYNLTLNNTTVAFDEKVGGWPSFKTFVPEAACALNNKYFSMKLGELWVHTNEQRNSFYGEDSDQTSITLLINDASETIKGFKTLNYSGSRSRVYTYNYGNATETFTKGWFAEYINTDQQEGFVKQFEKKENRYYNHIKGDATTLANLDSQEFSVQGIGHFTGSLAGDVNPADRNFIVNLTGIANTTNPGAKIEVTPATEVHSNSSTLTILITPNAGSTLTASDLSVNVSGNSYISSITFAQSGLNVIATVNITDGVNMPNNDVTNNIAVTGDGVVKRYKLHDLVLSHNTNGDVTFSKAYEGSGNATAEPKNAATGFEATYDGVTFDKVASFTMTIDPATNVFKSVPQFKILKQDTLKESQYEITRQDQEESSGSYSNITIGVGGKTLTDVHRSIFNIKYRFPAQDTSDDEIEFNAATVASATVEGNTITGYRVEGRPSLTRFAEDKNIHVYGKPGATFTFKRVIDSGTANYWDGDSFETGNTSLTIPSSGIYTVPVSFVQTSSSKVYQITLAGKSPTTLATSLAGNIYNANGTVQHPFDLNQYADVTLTLGASSASGDFTITSSNVSKTSTALSYPVEGSSLFSADLSITATAATSISQTRDPETTDYSNYNSNDFDWDFDLTSVVINNTPTPKTMVITGKAFIDRYGSASTTSQLNLDSMFDRASGSGGGGSLMLLGEVTGGNGGFINIPKITYNDGTYSTTNGKIIYIGTANNTNLTGTGTIFGNFYGNSLSEITLAISEGSGTSNTTSCFDNLTITKGTLTGTDSSQDLTYTWSGQFSETVTSSSVPKINVNVTLASNP